jgi:hypothetical protein
VAELLVTVDVECPSCDRAGAIRRTRAASISWLATGSFLESIQCNRNAPGRGPSRPARVGAGG